MDITNLQEFIAQYPWIADNFWVFTFGTMVALLRSVVDGARRSAGHLVAGCIFGGLGAALVHDATAGSSWRLVYTGAAAVLTERIVVGLYGAGDEFAKKPLEIFTRMWKLIVPSLPTIRGEGTLQSDSQVIENIEEEKP